MALVTTLKTWSYTLLLVVKELHKRSVSTSPTKGLAASLMMKGKMNSK